MVTEKGDKGGTKCVAGPGSRLALLTTIPWVPQGPLDSGGLGTCPFALLEKYGDVFTVHLGPRPVVMLCGTEAIREALVDQAEAFSGRGTVAVLDPIEQGYDVIFANGERWKTLRRFSLATMKDFGMGKRSVEEQIQEEARCVVEELQKSQDLAITSQRYHGNSQEISSCYIGDEIQTLFITTVQEVLLSDEPQLKC
ncbi:cytochrome P450 2B10-like [Microtus oregoni]|uniref:cytochrome P450 2B10-like n=1 Tax=Microtus oregoni TaxID=111838 RepID=UPI001BB16116|nr:cytochrome P450 2B10-like [Microtus oregoni]